MYSTRAETQVGATIAGNDYGRTGVMPPPRTSGLSRLSSRPTCLIYRVDRWWVLELDRISAWTESEAPPGVFHTFRALPLAISFAESRGLDYRIIHPKPLFVERRRKRLARLQRSSTDQAKLAEHALNTDGTNDGKGLTWKDDPRRKGIDSRDGRIGGCAEAARRSRSDGE